MKDCCENCCYLLSGADKTDELENVCLRTKKLIKDPAIIFCSYFCDKEIKNERSNKNKG